MPSAFSWSRSGWNLGRRWEQGEKIDGMRVNPLTSPCRVTQSNFVFPQKVIAYHKVTATQSSLSLWVLETAPSPCSLGPMMLIGLLVLDLVAACVLGPLYLSSFFKFKFFKDFIFGPLGGLVSWVAALGTGHDPGVQGSSPASRFLLCGELLLPLECFLLHAQARSLSNK